MQLLSLIKKRVFALLIALFATTNFLMATPHNMYFEPNPISSVWGKNRMPATRLNNDRYNMSVRISPFYMHTSGARNSAGRKTDLACRLGAWNMLGVFYGRAVMDKTSEVMPLVPFVPCPGDSSKSRQDYNPFEKYPAIAAAYLAIRGNDLNGGTAQTGNLPADAGQFTEAPDAYFALISEKNGEKFVGDTLTFGAYTIPAKYERSGLRADINLAAFGGFGLSIRAGFSQYRYMPEAFTSLPDKDTSQPTIESSLMSDTARNNISKDLGLDFDGKSAVAPEDTLIKFSYSRAFDMPDKKNNVVFKMGPYMSVGCWLPSGKSKDHSAFFSLPTGNDGFFAGVIEVGLTLDFIDTIQCNIGGGVAFFNSKSFDKMPVPSSKYQSSLYPWKTSIEKNPGISWDINASLHVDNFMEGLHFYADYVYARHEKDTITIVDGGRTITVPNLMIDSTPGLKDSAQIKDTDTLNVKLNDIFLASKMINESDWIDQSLTAGINYSLTPNCELGFSFQTHISGVRVFKTTTLMGTITFCF